jgi:uncharacterized protein
VLGGLSVWGVGHSEPDRRYYGTRMALFLAATFYATAALAGYAVEVPFGVLGLVLDPLDRAPARRGHLLELHHLAQHHLPRPRRRTLVVRFVRTGGMSMLTMMGGNPDDGGSENAHSHHHRAPWAAALRSRFPGRP